MAKRMVFKFKFCTRKLVRFSNIHEFVCCVYENVFLYFVGTCVYWCMVSLYSVYTIQCTHKNVASIFFFGLFFHFSFRHSIRMYGVSRTTVPMCLCTWKTSLLLMFRSFLFLWWPRCFFFSLSLALLLSIRTLSKMVYTQNVNYTRQTKQQH